MTIPSNNYSFSEYGYLPGRIRTASAERTNAPLNKEPEAAKRHYNVAAAQATMSSQEAREARAKDYIEAVRELKAQELSPKHTKASNTFLEIAHFENEPRLIDTYA